ncbi:MAG: F0F1 ATP synthase subunit delta [Dehalococcoidia bacterium]
MLRDLAAKRYAQACFELAVEHNELDRWESDLTTLAAVLETAGALDFVDSRKVTNEAKESFLRRTLEEPTPLVWNLVRLLAGKRRLGLLPQIAEQFQVLLDEHRGIAHAEVLTAVALGDDDRASLTQRLSELTGKQVTLEVHEEPAILGGLVARIGDRLIDGSTRSKLIALKRQLAGATR